MRVGAGLSNTWRAAASSARNVSAWATTALALFLTAITRASSTAASPTGSGSGFGSGSGSGPGPGAALRRASMREISMMALSWLSWPRCRKLSHLPVWPTEKRQQPNTASCLFISSLYQSSDSQY